jgi:predicted metal-dependent peptidase
MVDASGSMPDKMLAVAYEEICQALEQFNGSLTGVVGFFDTRVHGTKAFRSVEDIVKMKPTGGGGTDYDCIFEFIHDCHGVSEPTSIVIITDGEGEFPDESKAENVPVLWLMTKKKKAPWGKSVELD